MEEKRSVSELVDAQLERLEDEMERKVEERKGILAELDGKSRVSFLPLMIDVKDDGVVGNQCADQVGSQYSYCYSEDQF